MKDSRAFLFPYSSESHNKKGKLKTHVQVITTNKASKQALLICDSYMYLLFLSSSFWTTHCNLLFLTHSITHSFSISLRPRSAFTFEIARFLPSFLLHHHRSPSCTSSLQKKRKKCLEISAKPSYCLSPSSEGPQCPPSSSFSSSSSSFLSLSLALLLQLHRHDGPPALEYVARLQD